MKKFLTFALIWYSQQMAIPLFLSTKEFGLPSIGLNILVAVGFIIDYKKNG